MVIQLRGFGLATTIITNAFFHSTIVSIGTGLWNPFGGWNITNLGAILFARKLDEFPKLKRKAMRVILYKGKGRVET